MLKKVPAANASTARENGAPPAKTDPRPNRTKRPCRISQGKQAVDPMAQRPGTNCAQRARTHRPARQRACAEKSPETFRIRAGHALCASDRSSSTLAASATPSIMYGPSAKGGTHPDRCRADLSPALARHVFLVLATVVGSKAAARSSDRASCAEPLHRHDVRKRASRTRQDPQDTSVRAAFDHDHSREHENTVAPNAGGPNRRGICPGWVPPLV